MGVSSEGLLTGQCFQIIGGGEAIEHLIGQNPPLPAAVLKDRVGGPGATRLSSELRTNRLECLAVEFAQEKVGAGDVELAIARFVHYYQWIGIGESIRSVEVGHAATIKSHETPGAAKPEIPDGDFLHPSARFQEALGHGVRVQSLAVEFNRPALC